MIFGSRTLENVLLAGGQIDELHVIAGPAAIRQQRATGRAVR